MKRTTYTLASFLTVFGILYMASDNEEPPASTGAITDIVNPPVEVPLSTGKLVIEPKPEKEPNEPDLIVQELIEQHCLALAIYGEARGETAEGMTAVAWVVMNRVKRRQTNPCVEVLRRNQFEAFKKGSRLRRLANETIKGKLTFPSMNNRWIQNRINEIAHQVYTKAAPDPTKGATHFYAPIAQAKLGRQPPYWSQKLTYVRTAGNHKFYKEG